MRKSNNVKIKNAPDGSPEYFFELDYTEEKEDDDILREIKMFCFSYLDNISNLENKSLRELIEYRNFLAGKFEYFSRLKNSLKIKNYSWPITEISHHLDAITLSDSINAITTDSHLNIITKEINHAMEIIGLCHGIVLQMIEQKEQ